VNTTTGKLAVIGNFNMVGPFQIARDPSLAGITDAGPKA
jgi:hypothetical protein